MADGPLRDPLLAEQKQQQQPRRRGKAESIAGRVLSAATAARDHKYARRRKLASSQSTTDLASGKRILSLLVSPIVQTYKRFIEELKSFSLPAKAGVAAAICSILCFIPGPLSFLNKNGMWAVITADICIGANVGLSLYKGLNRTLGTLAAAGFAFLVVYVAPKFGDYEPYFMVFSTFLGAALPTVFKFRRPFKDRWNYAVVMSMVTFHILTLTSSEYAEKIKLPMIRMITILVGFCTASLVNLCVAPIYAGDVVSELVAKNFERAGNMMERCVVAYCDGMVLEQVAAIRAGQSEDDNIHSSFHDIVTADAEVSKLMGAVPYEPCHGKYFYGFPWHIYGDITDVLRYTLYDVAALDSCLRAEIQAPLHIRKVFEKEFQCIGQECAKLFRMIGDSLREMRHVNCLHAIQQAEEAALFLQYRIAQYINSEPGAIEAPSKEAREAQDAYEDRVSSSFRDAFDDPLFDTAESFFRPQTPPVERSNANSSDNGVNSKRPHLADEHHDFLQRQESMSRHWNTTVQRISVLSLLKFASILVELVAKAKFMTKIVDDLEIKARFADEKKRNLATTSPQPGNQQV